MSALRSAMNGAASITILRARRVRNRLQLAERKLCLWRRSRHKLSDAGDTFAPWQFSNPWFGTVRGRAGVAINNVLLFGTAGLAYGELTGMTSGNLSESHSSLGWVAGFGVEVSFTQHWSAKTEWLYLNFDDRQFSVTAANNGLAANLMRLGLNYHF